MALSHIFDRVSLVTKASQIGPIGLEFAREKLHLVQLERSTQHKITVRAKASLTYHTDRNGLFEDPRALKTLLSKGMKRNRFYCSQVVAALPLTNVRIMSIAYRTSGGQNEQQALRKLLTERLEGDLRDYVIDYLPVRSESRDEERLAIVAAARRDAVIDYLELMRKAGLQVRALEIGPVAIKRLISTLSEPDHQNVLALNFGRHSSYLTMISGRRLLFDQQIDFGERTLLQQISKALDMDEDGALRLVYQFGVDPSEHATSHQHVAIDDNDIRNTLMQIVKPSFLTLVEEINRALIYAASETRGETVKRIYLLGSIARWRGADEVLNWLLDIAVMNIPDPLSHFNPNPIPDAGSSDVPAPEIAVATGLALRGMIQDV
jgi:type IV pilus assembly protein PilM